MRKLVLVRHAKSGWEYVVNDANRPLAENGIIRAQKIAQLLKNQLDFVPEYWLSSYANRAQHTATIFAQTFECVENLQLSQELYTFLVNELLQVIHHLPDSVESCILFGHNEAMVQAVWELSDARPATFKTASIAYIEFEQNSWKEVENGKNIFILTKDDL